jgi:DGQHR domain-containing protein
MNESKKRHIEFPSLAIRQGSTTLYLLAAKASELWSILKINRKIEDKDEGYQRVLSASRVRAIARYIESKQVIGPSITVTFDKAVFDEKKGLLRVPTESDAGWVIDGQHRLAGAANAKDDINLPVVAFIGLDVESQIRQFVTINKEAKGVPSSLYYDLLKHIPGKKPADVAKERAADIAGILKRDEESPFFGRIVITTAPKKGELSLTNFVRKVAPLVQEGKGTFGPYTEQEQRHIISNYYNAIKNVFPKEFEMPNSIFFQTIGFGALMNALPTVFSICLAHYNGFRVQDVTKILNEIKDFEIGDLKNLGTGNAAELQAGKDIEEALRSAFETKGEEGALRLE